MTCAARVVVFLFAVAVAPTPAAAQDLAQDPTGLISLRLPSGWAAAPAEGPKSAAARGSLGAWTGRLGKSDDLLTCTIDVSVSRESRRGIQVLARLGDDSRPLGATTKTGEGWIQRAYVHEPRYTFWFRCIERAGAVIVLRAQFWTPEGDHDAEKQLGAIFESVQVLRDPGPAAPPSGSKSRKVGGFEVWAGDATTKEIKAVVAPLAAARRMVLKEMKGKPVDTGVPVLWIFDDADEFAAQARAGDWNTAHPDRAIYLPHADAVAILAGMDLGDREGLSLAYCGVAQALSDWFGGSAPTWLQHGLTKWFAFAPRPAYDPHEMDSKTIRRRKTSVATRSTRLDAQLRRNISQVMGPGDLGMLIVHQAFLRSKECPKKWRKLYRASLDAVRETGDPGAAAGAWDGTDFNAMVKDLVEWVQGL